MTPLHSAISTSELARLVGVSVRAAKTAAGKALQAQLSWRGITFRTFLVQGKGGRSGQTFAIEILSQPSAALAVAERPALPNPIIITGDDPAPARHFEDTRLAEWKRDIIAYVTKVPKDSPARAWKINEATHAFKWPAGRKQRQLVKASYVKRLVADYEKGEHHKLYRKERADKGARKVAVNEDWHKAAVACGMAPEKMWAIDDRVTTLVRSVLGSRDNPHVSASGVNIAIYSELHELSRTAGMDLPDEAMWEICRVPEWRVSREKNYRQLAIHGRDKRLNYDKFEPHVTRDRSHLVPYRQVCFDVQILDWIYQPVANEEGFHPHAMFFVDPATNMIVHHHIVFRSGFTREDTLRAMRGLVVDHYAFEVAICDRGSENAVAAVVDDLARMAAMSNKLQGMLRVMDAATFQAEHPEADFGVLGWEPGLRQALPGAPKGKLVETVLSILVKKYLPLVPAWEGGDRLRKITDRKGHPNSRRHNITSEEEYRYLLDAMVTLYNADPQKDSRLLQGRSPNQMFALHSKLYAPRVSPQHAEIALAKVHEGLRLDRDGTFGRKGAPHGFTRDPAVLAHKNQLITVRQSLDDPDRLFVFAPDNRKLLGVAHPAHLRHVKWDDPAGALLKGEMLGDARDARDMLRQNVEPLNLKQRMTAAAALAPARPALPHVQAIDIDLNCDWTAFEKLKAASAAEEEMDEDVLALKRGRIGGAIR